MGITERAVKNPAGVAVAVAIVTLFGLFSLNKLPVQLFPDIDLPQIPVRQGIAITGSLNQLGEIQAVGGVNEKVEGFFRMCAPKRASKERGVVLPRSNLEDLMLDPTVVAAVAAEDVAAGKKRKCLIQVRRLLMGVLYWTASLSRFRTCSATRQTNCRQQLMAVSKPNRLRCQRRALVSQLKPALQALRPPKTESRKKAKSAVVVAVANVRAMR